MQIKDYISQKKQSLIDTNKNLSEEKLRVEGAWLVLQEIENIMKQPEEITHTETTDVGENNHSPKTKKTKRGK